MPRKGTAKNQKEQQTAEVSASGPTSEEIAQRAYEIYQREGRIDGRDQDNWLRAETELKQERQNGELRPVGNGNGSRSQQR